MATSSAPDGGSGSHDPGAAGRVIARFGGIRPMANKLDVAVSTVQGWKERGHIPPNRRGEIRDVARALGIPLDEDELLAASGTPIRTPQPESGAADAPEDAGAERAPFPEPPVVEARAERREEAPRAEGPAARHAPAGRPWGWLAAAVVAGAVFGAVAGVGAWFALPYVLPEAGPPPAALADRIAAVQGRLDETAARMTAVESRLGEVSSGVEALRQEGAVEALRAELEAMKTEFTALDTSMSEMAEQLRTTDTGRLLEQVSGLRDRIDEIAGAVETARARIDDNAALAQEIAATRAAVDDLAARVDAVGSGASPADRAQQRNTGLLVALSNLRAAVEAGGGYGAELTALRTVLGEDPRAPWPGHLGPLEAHAAGVARMGALQARFPDTAEAVLAAAALPPDPDWLDRTLAELDRVVTVRRVGAAVEGAETDAVLARAEAALADGALGRAVAELERLDGAAAEAAAPWLADARALRDVRAALDALQTHLVSQLAPPPAQ